MSESLPEEDPPVSGTAGDASGSIAEIRRLVHDGRLEEARDRLAQLQTRGVQHPEIAKWASILEPPRCLPPSRPRNPENLRGNEAWLRAHAARYFGRWVALRGGELLGSDPDRVKLHRELQGMGELEGALFVRLAPG
jgi:hypothetical protein